MTPGRLEEGYVSEALSSPSTRRHRASYDELLQVARNLRWTWKIDARRLFARLDPSASPGALEWPEQLLLGLGRSRVEELLRDEEIRDLADEVVRNFRTYMAHGAKTWFSGTHRSQRDLLVAFFAAEFSLTDSLPIFAGGLGTVAAEQMKAASALGIPLVGVGLLYRGSSHQWLDREGRQHEAWDMMSPEQMPISRARDSQGREVQVAVSLPGRDLQVAVYEAQVGRRRLFLLDAALENNSEADRLLTTQLYDSRPDVRLAQELILGVGGMRALAALDLIPTTVHLNEGHSVFALLEHLRRVMAREGLSFEEARVAVRPSLIFTTHTPVAAGHDYFAPHLAREYLAPYAAQLAISTEELVSLGRVTPEWEGDSFCPTVFALRLAGHRNGVSRLHGEVTRRQWSMLWPRTPEVEVPITHVTNGVHLESWVTGPFAELLTSAIGAQWQTTPGDPVMWSKLTRANDAALWQVKNKARADLVEFARRRARKDLARRHAPTERVAAVSVLHEDFLTIGFVGRFVAYKRPTLLLRDPERLAAILKNPARPVQIVFAGKAHSSDEGGKRLLADMIDFASRYGVSDRVVFMVDFDTTMDRAMTQGVDLWLNTPRRPLEACGVGGMKAGMNGVLNLSTIDGWWDEALADADPSAPPIGFTIGNKERWEDESAQDDFDADSLYTVLEEEIVPAFYERDADGVPRRWLASVKQSMSTLAPTWDSLRMTREYTERFYLPGLVKSEQLLAGGAQSARDRTAHQRRLRAHWSELALRVEKEVPVSTGLDLEVGVHLGALEPADLSVQVWREAEGCRPLDAFLIDRRDVHARYRVHLDATDLENEWALRIVPSLVHTDGDVEAGLIVWAS